MSRAIRSEATKEILKNARVKAAERVAEQKQEYNGAYDAGIAAFKDGKRLEACPWGFDHWSKMWGWQAGWKAARRHDLETREDERAAQAAKDAALIAAHEAEKQHATDAQTGEK